MRSVLAIFLALGFLRPIAAQDQEWIPFNPPPDNFENNPIDLRHLNEKIAGENGFVTARDGKFFLGGHRDPVRFWAVNGPPSSVKDPAELRRVARSLAARGVNLVRIHGAVFTSAGEPDPAKVQHVIDIVEAMKLEGIYSHASIYFPLWFRPKADLAWLPGYDGKKHPFATLMFNSQFQARYRDWWTALLTTPGARSGKKLIDEPALMGAELQNEDSFFFWTFNEQNIPEPQLQILESLFTDWAKRKHGSIENALAAWNNLKVKRDSDTRLGFRPLWNMANEKTARDKDTAAFLLELQTRFYTESSQHLRKLGFKGLITVSNWATASPEVFGPLEKLSYTTGDFIDRHGYFAGFHKGENSEWSIRDGHTFAHRSALRFEPVQPGKPRLFVHPVMDPHYANMPSMISETTFTRPNRFRSEAPLYFAVYGALQDTDAIVHFAYDGADWKVKPNFWMQPWTLMSPAMMGQFPAAALIYRKGRVKTGDLVARVSLRRDELLALEGTPLPQDAAFDELRLKDVPADSNLKPGQTLDPLLHYVGRSEVQFTNRAAVELNLLKDAIDHSAKRITSSTGQLKLDYGNGTLTINAPSAQGISGNLRALADAKLDDIAIRSELDLGHIIVISLDDQPIKSSSRLLLQVMSEEQNSDWKTEPLENEMLRITSIGRDPWTIKPISGTVRFLRPDASRLKVFALAANGTVVAEMGDAKEINLRPETIYYLVTTKN